MPKYAIKITSCSNFCELRKKKCIRKTILRFMEMNRKNPLKKNRGNLFKLLAIILTFRDASPIPCTQIGKTGESLYSKKGSPTFQTTFRGIERQPRSLVNFSRSSFNSGILFPNVPCFMTQFLCNPISGRRIAVRSRSTPGTIKVVFLHKPTSYECIHLFCEPEKNPHFREKSFGEENGGPNRESGRRVGFGFHNEQTIGCA